MTTLLNPFSRPLHVQSWPRPAGSIDYRVTNPYGGVDLVNPEQRHQGTDIGNTRENDPLSAPVQCMAMGLRHFDGALGVKLSLGGGWILEFWHLNRLAIPRDTWTFLELGQLMGHTGSTGNVQGAHTHVEIKLNGKATDPAPYLPMVEREALAVPGATAGTRYVDVPLSHPFYLEIEHLSGQGILTGIGGGKFGPDRALTREEFAAALYRALKADDES